VHCPEDDAPQGQATPNGAEDWEEIGTITVGANWIAQLGGAVGDGPHLVKVLSHKDRVASKIRCK
jgi:hypothetical protein